MGNQTRPSELTLHVTPALLAVIAERERQVLMEGWTLEHDDEHTDGSLAQAAVCYAVPMATIRKDERVDVSGGRGETSVWDRKTFRVPKLWPDSWHASWWKPKDERSNLVRAAALLLAEIERRDRAGRCNCSGIGHNGVSPTCPIHAGAEASDTDRYCGWQRGKCPVPAKCNDAGRCLNVVSPPVKRVHEAQPQASTVERLMELVRTLPPRADGVLRGEHLKEIEAIARAIAAGVDAFDGHDSACRIRVGQGCDCGSAAGVSVCAACGGDGRGYQGWPCPKCRGKGAHGVAPSAEARQQEYERMHGLAHAWAQECYFKGLGLGRPARIDETRGAFQKELRALIARGMKGPDHG